MRWLAIVISVCSILAIAWSMPVKAVADVLQARALRADVWDGLVFIGCYLLFTTLFVPVWPMPFLAGAMFGSLLGTALASASCIIAAAVTFLLARLLGRTSVRKAAESSPRLRALENAVQEDDWKIVAAVRLAHFMTFGMQNYAFGFTRIRFGLFLFTTWAVTLPGTLLQCSLGHLGFTSLDAWRDQSAPGWQAWGMRIAGLCFIAAAVGYIAYRGRAVYRDVYKKQLEQQLQVEHRRAESRGWPLSTILLCVLSIVLATCAAVSVTQREGLRQLVERLSTT